MCAESEPWISDVKMTSKSTAEATCTLFTLRRRVSNSERAIKVMCTVLTCGSSKVTVYAQVNECLSTMQGTMFG